MTPAAPHRGPLATSLAASSGKRTPRSSRTGLPAAFLGLVLASLAGPATAQFAQYTAPGSLALTPVATKEALEEAMEQAPWNLGPVRLAPWFAVHDVTYYSRVEGVAGQDQGDDLTASVGAGLLAYLPVGQHFTIAAHALPEYVWWKNNSERRLWNGTYGVGAFGYFSRLTVEAKGTRARQQQIASAELEQPVNVRTDSDTVKLEFRVFERLALFAEGEKRQIRYRDQDLAFGSGSRLSQLDRDETHVGGGVRYRPRPHVMLGVGVDRVTSEFKDPTGDRSSSGTGPFAEVGLEGRKVEVRGRVAWVSLDPESSSDFAPYSDATGTLSLAWQPGRSLAWRVYGGRSLAFSYAAGTPYYVDSRAGVAVTGKVGWRGTYSVFYESGTNSYRDSTGSSPYQDDLEAYGISFDVKVGRLASLVFGGEKTAYTSSVPGRSRDLTRWLASLRLSSSSAKWW